MTRETIPFWTPGISGSFKENEQRKAREEAERLAKKIRDHEEYQRTKEQRRIKREEMKRAEENRKKFTNVTGGLET